MSFIRRNIFSIIMVPIALMCVVTWLFVDDLSPEERSRYSVELCSGHGGVKKVDRDKSYFYVQLKVTCNNGIMVIGNFQPQGAQK